jgi:hypothetical protein
MYQRVPQSRPKNWTAKKYYTKYTNGYLGQERVIYGVNG